MEGQTATLELPLGQHILGPLEGSSWHFLGFLGLKHEKEEALMV